MAIVPLFGHHELRDQLLSAARRQALPASLLLYGPRGVGKQRLALWIAQLLLCEKPDLAPCNACTSCRFATELTHPDLHWFFPRPRLKDSNADLADVREDLAEAAAERAGDGGLYSPPPGNEGIFVATVRAIVQSAAMSPAIARRKVFLIGDAERMVSQEGSDQAANAFLKLLEEPPADTTVILTSSEPGALLPTIRSRVVSLRVGTLGDDDVRAFLKSEPVSRRLDKDRSIPADTAERLTFASGAPGRLLAGAEWATAMENARRLLDAALAGKPAARYEVAWTQSSNKARGSFADTLDALSITLHRRARRAAQEGADRQALGSARAIEAVELAKERIASNVSPQLITVNLVRELQELIS